MAGLQDSGGYVKSQMLRNLKGLEFGGVEVRWNPPERTNQSVMDGSIRPSPDSSPVARGPAMDEVPASLTKKRIEKVRVYFFQERPVVSIRLLKQVEMCRQVTFLAKKDGLLFHA